MPAQDQPAVDAGRNRSGGVLQKLERVVNIAIVADDQRH